MGCARGQTGNHHTISTVTAALLLVLAQRPALDAEERISKPGRYQGYSKAIYDGWQRASQYVTVRDGTKIALDILRPTRNGALHTEPLPVVWEQRRYHRAVIDPSGRIYSQLDRGDHPMRKLLPYGYVFVVADVRGAGASFGTRVDPTPPAESLDAYDITEWIAARPWCSGRVGMYGISYAGSAQFMAASVHPPHLKAVFPEMAMFDLYDLCYPGGIYRHTLMRAWQQQVRALDLSQGQRVAPVDEDKDQHLLAEAIRQHRDNFDVEKASAMAFRDAVSPEEGRVYTENSPVTYVEKVKTSGVAVYQRAGWFDMYPRDMLLWFCNLRTPRKIAIGPWDHYQSHGLDRGTEMLRWFDYWLKGIDNGIMDEPPILYCVMGAPEDRAIRWASQWPLPEAKSMSCYFCGGPSGSVKSVNDGLLSPTPGQAGADSYVVDYTTSSGNRTRWTGGPTAYADMMPNDRKALTYTTEPLAEPVEVVGHPVVRIWIQSSAEDVDVFAYLEEVAAQGQSRYITEGCLRASHRAPAQAPFACMDLPYHSCSEKNTERLPEGEPVELVFDLLPTAKHFPSGARMRVAVTCADQDNCPSRERSPAPTVTVLRDPQHPSRIVLPIVRE